MKVVAVLLCLVILAGCSWSATVADLKSLGKEHKVTMWSGGQLVREWTSAGKVESMSESDGWQFMDKGSGQLIRVGGDVIIEVIN